MWNSNRKAKVSLLIVMAIGAIIVGTNAKPPSRIRGGQDVGPNEGTFVVRLTLSGSRPTGECTGAIIGPRHILTAGHCVDGRDHGLVYGGTRHRSDQNSIVSNISRVYKHPQYGTAYGGYDVGIVEVDKDLDLSGRQISVPLTTSEINFNSRGFQFGWSTCGSDRQMALQKLNVGFLIKDICNKRGGNDQYPQILCVDTDLAEICPGDSGGPILSGGRVVGIGSTSANERGQPAGSQNVYHYLDWINSIIRQ